MRCSEATRRAFDGAALFTRRWTPDGSTKGVVCLVHGFGEHTGRYVHVAEHLARAGYALSAFDLRGHGRSDGRRGDARFSPTLRDIDDLLEDERGRAEGAPVFLYGHSLGGLLALTWCLARGARLPGVVVSGPALHTAAREKRLKVLVTRLFGRLVPTLTVSGVLDREKLMRDPAALAAYVADPLVHNQGTAGFGLDAIAAMDRVLERAQDLASPLLLLHGGADRMNYPSGSLHVADKLGSRCTLRVYDGVFHTLHHEPERGQVLDDVVAWLDARAAAIADAA